MTAAPGVPPRIGRRRLLEMGASYLLATPWLVPARKSRADEEERARLAWALDTIFADPVTARTAGAQYLRHHPDEATLGRLQAALFGAGRFGPRGSVTRWMAERRARDLEEEDIVVIEGWVLARSEARLCALATLLAAV